MKERVKIVPANLRDVSWITANLRPLDHKEAYCQYAIGSAELAYFLLANSDAFVAMLDGFPVMAFGTSPMTITGVSVWALGTKRARKVIPTVTEFFCAAILPKRMEEGFRWAEARSLATHYAAHEWMKSLGGEAVLRLPDYGKDGEEFILYRWHRSTFEDQDGYE